MKNLNRLEVIRRAIVDKLIMQMDSRRAKAIAYIHLYGVSQTASLLAIKRNLSPEIAAIAGMLHDYYSMLTGNFKNHDQNSAEAIRPIIRDLNIFSKEEINIILNAVFHHSDKMKVHSEYDELLKDADVLQHYLYDVNLKVNDYEAVRLKKIHDELGMIADFDIVTEEENNISYLIDKRNLMADIAKGLAEKKLIGLPGNSDYKEICNYWPGDNVYKELKDNWCAAFVYHCAVKAGFNLPIRHPDIEFRFACVAAWLKWSKLTSSNYFHQSSDKDFIPSKGDIVIFDKLLSEKSNDHIGIVLASEKDYIVSAEGNLDNSNISGIKERVRNETISGYIRIANDYQYSYTGIYKI